LPQNIYQQTLTGPYRHFHVGVASAAKRLGVTDRDPYIIDLCSNNGTAMPVLAGIYPEASVLCVDQDADALAKVDGAGMRVETLCMDANDFLRSCSGRKVDLIICIAGLHEINDHTRQMLYLTSEFFPAVANMLRPDGLLLIGDYYYPPFLGDGEVNAYIEALRERMGHGDERRKFIDPQDLIAAATKYSCGMELVTSDVQYEPESDLRYVYTQVYRPSI